MNSENGRTDAERRLAERLHAWAESGERAGRRYASLPELMLDLGEWHRPTPFPRELRRRRGRYTACYANAARLAASVDGLRYVEGFADPGLEPDGHAFEHAWCVTADGTVVDPTWADDPAPTAYLGVPLRLDYRNTVRRERPRKFRSVQRVLDLWADPALMTEGLPEDAVPDVLDRALSR